MLKSLPLEPNYAPAYPFLLALLMIYTREKLEHNERLTLAPYAALSSASRGRVYPESESKHRTAFQKDRDRVIHTSAFRRLEYKTQVFVNYEGDYYRTRLDAHARGGAGRQKHLARAWASTTT